jgi:uncharacterized SAM-dependent methyltransferase
LLKDRHLNPHEFIQVTAMIKNETPSSTIEQKVGEEVIQGLTQTQKTLPAKYLYDARGSELFEQICDLPEYYPTRTKPQFCVNMPMKLPKSQVFANW